MPADRTFDCLVVGTGPAGLAAALALALQGGRIALAGPPMAGVQDRRTAALFTGSIELLRNLGVWEALEPVSAPIAGIRLVDDSGGLLRAPEVVFTAAEVGLDVLGYNVPNQPLAEALARAVRASGRVSVLETARVERLETGGDVATAQLADGTSISAPLVAGADGRNSVCRQGAGISTRNWGYEQAALVCMLAHGRPHDGISTEFHRPNGPFTVVPLRGNASSLVWVERPAIAERLARLSDAELRAAIETRLMGLLGPIGAIEGRAVFPLSGLTATVFAANRVALIGEAGHVIPPIGAQGLNLGLRDAAALADCYADARAQGRDPGGPEAMAAFDAARRADVGSRIWTVDLLNRSLISGLIPVQLARGLGLHMLGAVGPLRRLLVREGLQPSFAWPRLMRPGPAEGRAGQEGLTGQASPS